MVFRYAKQSLFKLKVNAFNDSEMILFIVPVRFIASICANAIINRHGDELGHTGFSIRSSIVTKHYRVLSGINAL